MSLRCPQCSYENPESSIFCARCGYDFRPIGNAALGASTSTGQMFMPPADASAPLAQPPYAPPASSLTSPYGPLPSPHYSSFPQQAVVAPVQMGTGQGGVSIRRAFAGHGTLVTHHSWLIPGNHVHAPIVTTAVLQKLQQRAIPHLTVKSERLMERGVLTEERDYLTISRSVSTVFTYVAPAGQDLYISRATTVLPTMSTVRMIIFGALLCIALFTPGIVQSMIYSSVNNSVGSAGGALGGAGAAVAQGAAQIAGFVALAYISGPIIIFFVAVLVRSIIMLIVEKDFWWFLRPSTLNDFQLDDIALLEHLSDEVIHDAVQELGLDASKIQPPPTGYAPKRRIRII